MTEQETQTPPGPQPQPGTPPPRRYPPLNELHRSRTDRKVLGVAGGLGRYAGVDPLIFRILFVVLAIFGGSGVLLYALGWLLFPDDGEDYSEAQRLLNGSARRSTVSTVVAGLVAVIVGLFLVGGLLDTGPGLGGLGAVIVVVAIVVLVARSGPQPVTTAQAPQQPYGPVPPPEPGAYGQTPGTAYAVTAPVPPPPPPYVPRMPYVPPPPRPPKQRSILGRATVSMALIVVGLMVGWNASTDHDIKAVAILASALAVVGAGLVVGAFRGRARGLIVLGILLSLATSITAVADDKIVGGLGERDWVPTTVAQAHRDYRLGVGEGRLDLTDLPSGSTVAVNARVGIGHLQITIPDAATVHFTGHVDAGVMRIPGEPEQSDDDLNADLTLDPVPGVSPNGTDITIEAKLGFGELEVRRATS